MTAYDRQIRPTPKASFSIPAIIAIAAAVGSFMVGPGLGLVLAVVAIVAGVIGFIIALLPSVRGGVVSILSIVAGLIGIVAAVLKFVL